MTKTLVLSISAVAALGILIGVAVMLRGEAPPESAPPRSGSLPTGPVARSAALVPIEAPDPEILRRVDEMEGRLNQLLKRRDDLARNNVSIRKEMKEVQAERTYKSNASTFVAMLAAKIGGATEAQRGALADIWVKWNKEDELGDVWKSEDEAQTRRRLMDREAELRALLSADQQGKMQTDAAARIRMRWERAAMELANDLGYPVVGVSRAESTRSINKVLRLMGEAPAAPSGAMMLSGAHGADLPTLKRLAADRLRPQLAAEDASRLTNLPSEQSRRAIAGSWVYDWQ